MKPTKPLRRSPMRKRAPYLRKVGARALREADELQAFRADPPERCERCNKRRPLDAHHLRPRSRGGKHTPDNRAFLCRPCHRGVHDRALPDSERWIR